MVPPPPAAATAPKFPSLRVLKAGKETVTVHMGKKAM